MKNTLAATLTTAVLAIATAATAFAGSTPWGAMSRISPASKDGSWWRSTASITAADPQPAMMNLEVPLPTYKLPPAPWNTLDTAVTKAQVHAKWINEVVNAARSSLVIGTA